MKLAVIGAGWAGLSAATTLKAHGATVTVFEASGAVGGRARGVHDATLGTIDNGQHLLLGAYTETLALIETWHPNEDLSHLLLRFALRIDSADGRIALGSGRLPAPLHALWALLSARGLSWGARWRAAQMMFKLKRANWQAPSGMTVEQLLIAYQQPAELTENVWIPLCLATMNTAIQEACAQLFLNVLRDSMDSARRHSDMLLPRTDLSALWPTAAAQSFALRYRHVVRAVTPVTEGVLIDGELFDGCVVAVPPYACSRLEDRSRGHLGQWLFSRTATQDQFTVVVSDAPDLLKYDREALISNLADQIRTQTLIHPASRKKNFGQMPAVRAHRLIVEKRATFAAVPGLKRPAVTSPWKALTLAGDWTDTGYPAVLEGAVRSGKQAAQHLLLQLEAGQHAAAS